MGGSSGGQVTGYRYFTNLLLFIGNPIENLLAINFDKRGWISGDRASDGDNGELIGIKAQNLYGENEGGVYGVINLHTGTNAQLPDAKYSQYMSSKGLQASAYPYQSYLSFSGSGKANTGNSLIDGVFGVLAGYMNDAFYVGNSGYMKEMLLWPMRIHVRNDGSRQWYDQKAEIFGGDVDSYIESMSPVRLTTMYKAIFINSQPIEVEEVKYADMNNHSIFKSSAVYSYGNKDFINSYVNTKISIETPGTAECEIQIKYALNRDHIKLILPPYTELVSRTSNGNLIHEIYKSEVDFNEPVYVEVADLGPTGERTHLEITSIELKEFYPKTSFGDINPVHKIREILTDDTAMNKPESSVNDQNFRKAADRLRKESLGVSWSITEKSCIDAINELCYHIEAGIRVNRQTGLYEMVLFRDNWFDESEIHTISESKIKSMQYEITNADEVINQVNVNYYDRSNIKNSSFSISESGLIQTLGRVNAETLDFPYFMNMRNAEIVANWKLKQLSTGAFKGSFTTGWREARKWNRYDLIRLPWSKRWTGTILVRIMSINLGGPTNNEVSIEFIEVVPATGMMNTTIVIDDPIDTKPEAPKPCNAKVFELPYFEAVQAFGERNVNTELTDNPEVGYLCAIAEKPQNNSLNASLHTDSGNGFERVATVNYCETAYLDQAIDRMSNTFILKNVGNIASVRAGSQIFINDETMVYQSYDTETKVLAVKRGALDSIPQNHATNSILYFADDFVAVDQNLYVEGETIDVKVLTTTPSGVLALDDAANSKVAFKARAIRPYPPANVKINGKYWPAYIDTDLTIQWVNRNRAQQTGGEILGWFEAGVNLEPNTATMLVIIERDTNMQELATNSLNVTAVNSHTLQRSLMQPDTEYLDITLSTVRDGYSCMNPFHLTLVNSKLKAPENVQFKVVKI